MDAAEGRIFFFHWPQAENVMHNVMYIRLQLPDLL